jgi:hypothetical protein
VKIIFSGAREREVKSGEPGKIGNGRSALWRAIVSRSTAAIIGYCVVKPLDLYEDFDGHVLYEG